MAIELISKIKPKNNGTFAMVDAVDVELSDGARLEAYLQIAAAALAALQEAVAELQENPVTVDDALSETSTNPVQNKVIAALFNEAGEVIASIGGAVSSLQTGMGELAKKTLPTVTDADNDKILQVVDGAWGAVTMTDVSEVGM